MHSAAAMGAPPGFAISMDVAALCPRNGALDRPTSDTAVSGLDLVELVSVAQNRCRMESDYQVLKPDVGLNRFSKMKLGGVPQPYARCDGVFALNWYLKSFATLPNIEG